jgi:urea transport system ATP-binding protein
MTPYERARSGIGYVPQGREIFGRLTVEDNLRMGLAYKSGARRFRRSCTSCSRCSSRCCTAAAATCPAASSSSWPLPARWRRAQAADPGRAHRRHPAQHHQGHRPRDPHAGQGAGMAILLCEQYYDFAEELADHYLVMERGEVIASGPGSEMQEKGIQKLVAI